MMSLRLERDRVVLCIQEACIHERNSSILECVLRLDISVNARTNGRRECKVNLPLISQELYMSIAGFLKYL